MPHRLPNAVPDFSKAAVLVVGDVMLDRYWFGDANRISPEAPVPIVKVSDVHTRPGGAGNVALNIKALGAETTLLAITGNDEAAQDLSKQLASAAVVHDLHRVDTLSTIIKLRIISQHQQLIRIDFEDGLTLVDNRHFIERYQAYLTSCKLVVLSDYKKGTLFDPQPFIQLARQAHTPVLIDPKGSDFSVYQYADIITPNYKEFEAVVGRCHSEQAIIDKGRTLLEKYAIGALLVTRGEDGMTLIQPQETLHLPAYAHEVFDVTGAGDTVMAVLAASIAIGMDLTLAATLANFAAGLAVSKLGAVTIGWTELQTALADKNKMTSKILNEAQLSCAVHEARAQGKRVVFTNGCFDILHAGHVTYLQLAKQLGDYLVIAVNTNESVQKLKGQNRPINDLKQRMMVLAGLSTVDWVVPFTDETPERLLNLVRPDVLVKGNDYDINQVVGADIVRAYGGEVRVIHHDISTSSTAILRRAQEND
jgi:D-beta-D-heptose 7-phosphate kinase/D-beta-D-heptose 1-phosphate adenosyltransferase